MLEGITHLVRDRVDEVVDEDDVSSETECTNGETVKTNNQHRRANHRSPCNKEVISILSVK